VAVPMQAPEALKKYIGGNGIRDEQIGIDV
jgi:hypothetical protein